MQSSIINKSELDEIMFRIDAEYYKPEFLKIENHLKSKRTTTIRKSSGRLDCSAFYPSITPFYNFNGIGTPFLRVNEIQNGLIKITPDTVFLPESVLNENKSTIAKLEPKDIVIAKGGNTLGKIALLTDKYPEYSICRDVLVLRTSELNGLNVYYLWIFLHSNLGQKTLLRTASQTGQPHLTLESLYELTIPSFSTSFQNYFENIFYKSQDLMALSNHIYSKAEQLIIDELNLSNWNSIHQLSFSRTYSVAENNNRIDAEYFQPKYAELINLIKQYNGGFDSLGNLVNVKDDNFTPESNTTYKYIELANIGNNGEITGFTEASGPELPTRARRKVSSNDIIVSSIEGSLSSIALIEDSLDDALCSTGFYVINSDLFNSETSLVLLKSVVGQLQLKKGCSGTILTAINKGELSKIILPKIDQNIQDEIKTKITEMYDSRGKSKHLLEIAKRGVEMAIEQDETTAENWINEELEKLGADLNE